MKIVELRGFHVGFSPNPAIGNARTFIRRRDFLLLQLLADDGSIGWGEVFNSPHAAGAFIQARLAAHILGQSPADYRRIFDRMSGVLGYDRRGAAMMAVSAIDMALHDLAAQAQGISVCAMLGGALRDRVFAYASGPFIAEGAAPYAKYEEQVETYLKRGYRAVKPRGGAGPKLDGEMARALRSAVGPDIGLMVDINQGYSAQAAIRSARYMEESDLLWLEEPVMPEDLPGYRAVAAASPIAIAGGEALGSLAAFRDFLAAGPSMSILQPDLTVCGGFSGFMKIAALADAYDIPVMPHAFGTIVNHSAAVQAAALMTERRSTGAQSYPYVEIDCTDNPLLHVAGAVTVGPDGKVEIPDAPGLGLDLSAEKLKPWITSTWSCAF
ncbi:mandelate racemase/muconate lactonizing enzyme family protein [Pseudolabrys sp. FHR47]|uniref:mandelate racemase/muconate lactonizing enzyme family protein n=1 Tax=Pseudolabrys sp. FHR47 TaxID=2562284 RepID=UPI0010BE4298|nr:mandelate racemase/muconate lactonizing enzyme family protein [Pseudolabrys sp. FHR47]